MASLLVDLRFAMNAREGACVPRGRDRLCGRNAALSTRTRTERSEIMERNRIQVVAQDAMMAFLPGVLFPLPSARRG
jgi:hypothetical protein